MQTRHTLILLRHGKSDWSGRHSDRRRPLAKRGLRQVPESARWLSEYAGTIDLAVVSPAARAFGTWELVAEELGEAAPPVQEEEAAYTFDSDDLLDILTGLDDAVGTVLMVGHNPALEELASELSGERVPMPTAAVAVVDLGSAWSELRPGAGRLVAAGRPPSGTPLR